jgi:hypothetical protein
MKNKEKYDLRELRVSVFQVKKYENTLTVYHKKEKIYETDIGNSIDFEKFYNEWLEEECEVVDDEC